MNHFSTFPFVRYVILLIVGILLYRFFPSFSIYFVFGSWIFFAFLYAAFFIFRRKITNHLFAGFAGSLFLILTAYGISFLKHEVNYPQHYTHLVENIQYYEVIVDNLVEEKENSWKGVGQVRSVIINNEILSTSGKILLYFDNRTVEKPRYGDIFFVKGSPQEIASPKNPEEFDYQQYMRNQNINYQQYLRSENIEKVGNQPPEILINFALKINAHADSILTTFVEGKNQYGVANAMILGQRDDLSNDLMQAYSAAGAIHVLSVSGLHVGVIYAVLLWLLGSLKKKGKWGKIILFWSIFLIFFVGVTHLLQVCLRLFCVLPLCFLFFCFQLFFRETKMLITQLLFLLFVFYFTILIFYLT